MGKILSDSIQNFSQTHWERGGLPPPSPILRALPVISFL